MKDNFPNRKNIRLKDFNYAQSGYYFITICTQNKIKILSKIITVGANCVRPEIELTNIGTKINNELNLIKDKYDNIFIESYVIMPNHVHIVIQITDNRANTVRPYNI